MKKLKAFMRTLTGSVLEILEFLHSIFLSALPMEKPRSIRASQILIIPGILSGPRFYKKLQMRLESYGYLVSIIPLPAYFRKPETPKSILIEYLSQVPKNATVIAHNTGGLSVMVLPDSARRKIKRLITLGTPFRGSHLLRLMGIAPWKYPSADLENFLNTVLFLDRFSPFSTIKELFFLPAKSSEFGQGRDWWFDIPGNFNLVRREENIQTLAEFLLEVEPPLAKDTQTTESIRMPPITKQIAKSKKSEGQKRPVKKSSKGPSQKSAKKANKSISRPKAKKKSTSQSKKTKSGNR